MEKRFMISKFISSFLLKGIAGTYINQILLTNKYPGNTIFAPYKYFSLTYQGSWINEIA